MKTQADIKDEALAVLIIGGSGTGKSTTALRFPKPGIILAGDNLLNGMKLNPGVTFKYDIIDTDKDGKELPMDRRWERAVELTKEMIADPEVQTVVYDNGTRLGETLALHLGRTALSEFEMVAGWRLPKKSGWTPLSMEMGKMLMSVRAARKHLVMTVHDRLREDELDKVLDIRPFIPGALGKNLPKCSAIERLNMDDLNNIDIDLSGIDLSRPLLGKQILRCRTGDVKVEADQTKGTRRLVVPLSLETPGTDTKGKQVNVGFQVTDSILLTPTGKLTQEMINERLARFQIAVLGLDKPQRFGAPSDYSGKLVNVLFDVRTSDDGVVRQDIKRYTAVKD